MTKKTAAPNRPRKLVVGIDFSEMSEQALDVALDTAAAGRSTEVHGLFVRQTVGETLNPYAMAMPPLVDDELKQLRTMMDRHVKASLKKYGLSRLAAVVAHAALGSPALEIARLAAEIDADLVIVGTHGRKGLDRFFLGSVAEKTVRLCGCPVYVVRPKNHAHDDKGPQVEPSCPDCLEHRAKSKDAGLWCARHAEHHPRAHVYSYEGPSTDSARPWGFDGP